MELINGIQEKFRQNQFEFSKHAANRMILRHDEWIGFKVRAI